MRFRYNGKNIELQTVNKMMICGLYYAQSKEEEHKLNVTDKMSKLQNKIKLWSHRHLTLEGKTLIVKTFGLSQIIYNMQCYKFERSDLKTIESDIFRFLWSTNKSQHGIDRIKRSIMKNEYSEGGMNVTDPECLDRALKWRQFVRAGKSRHEIAKIQSALSSKSTDIPLLRQEYYPVTSKECICESAQDTMNLITDFNREEYKKLKREEYKSDKILIDEVSSINVNKFLL